MITATPFYNFAAILAEFHLQRVLVAALASAAVPIVLQLVLRSAQKQMLVPTSRPSLTYVKAVRAFVLLCWGLVVSFSIFLGFRVKGTEIWALVFIVCFFLALIIPFHLEVFYTSITWDDVSIYTRSPWQGRRTIPFSAIKSCDFSAQAQWYRIHTDGYGIIRLPTAMCGVQELLQALPCSHPPYPPKPKNI